ncbi:hypothetical protein M407DRAFT_30296 [Tulasnella calospora MUT 4182]|uniref:Ubiquitin-like protease family profile domain-containing protein n=1 Tax=Tulasnella calospora MUT 4182 TaxID=1051891 RepID=A0A0C3Q7K3_9AGAM|nr:hypothetical protein M407DRAFT_30296 [Tulasnella calospora MUT 4182]
MENGVPQLGDLAAILGEIDAREQEGALGVVLELYSGSLSTFLFWSIQEIRTFVHIENNREAVDLGVQAHRLVCHLPSGSVNSEDVDANFLASLPIRTTIQGFSTPVRAWELGCLAQETAVFDTVLDLRAELAYLTHQVTLSASRSHFIFPSLFASSLIQLFRQPHPNRTFSSQFRRIRAKIQTLSASGKFDGMSFVLCQSGHFTAFHFDSKSGKLYVDDSLSGGSKPWSNTSTSEMISALEWLLSGLRCKQVRKICDMELEQQHAASQSCGVIAFNGIERLLGLYSGRWAPERASEERTRWFMELVNHWQRSRQCMDQAPWLTEDSDNLDSGSDSDEWYSWDCWNLKRINVGNWTQFCFAD